MACCYQLLCMMVIQKGQPGLETPAVMRGTPCPAGFPVGTDLAGAGAAALCCGASAGVQSLVQALALRCLPWYKFSPWMYLPSLFPFPPKVPRGRTGKLLGSLLLSWPPCLPMQPYIWGNFKSWELVLQGHYSKLTCVRKAGVGRRLCWCQLSCAGPTHMKWLSLAQCLLQFFTSGPALESTLKCLFPKPSGSMVIFYKYLPNKAIFSPNLNNPSSLSHMLFGMNLSLHI